MLAIGFISFMIDDTGVKFDNEADWVQWNDEFLRKLKSLFRHVDSFNLSITILFHKSCGNTKTIHLENWFSFKVKRHLLK